MAVRDWAHEFDESEQLVKISISQSDESLWGHHKGHATLIFNRGFNISPMLNEIQSVPGVDRTETFNHNEGLMLSIKDGHDAFTTVGKLLPLLSEQGFLGHDQQILLYKELGLTTAPSHPHSTAKQL